jgi:hypothetical protein
MSEAQKLGRGSSERAQHSRRRGLPDVLDLIIQAREVREQPSAPPRTAQ